MTTLYDVRISPEFFAVVGMLITLGAAWTHLIVKLDRIDRRIRVLETVVKLRKLRVADLATFPERRGESTD